MKKDIFNMNTAFTLAISEKALADRILDIQEYGKQCAIKAFKDAAERAKLLYDDVPFSDALGVDPESITSTPILTP